MKHQDPDTWLDKLQVPFFKSLVWPDQESNPAYLVARALPTVQLS